MVVLHGCVEPVPVAMSEAPFNRVADEKGFDVLWPQQSAAANPDLCWNWEFPPSRWLGDSALIGGHPGC